MTVELESLFRISGPTEADIDSFHNDGYIVYPDVLTDEARENLIAEITEYEPVRQYLDALGQNGGNRNRISFALGTNADRIVTG